MDLFALILLIGGWIGNVKGLVITALVISAICFIINILVGADANDKIEKMPKELIDLSDAERKEELEERRGKAQLGIYVYLLVIALSIVKLAIM